jgi:hypothetical protein
LVAQYATATYCRTCSSAATHPAGRWLSPAEQAYALDIVCRWIETELAASGRAPFYARARRRTPTHVDLQAHIAHPGIAHSWA